MYSLCPTECCGEEFVALCVCACPCVPVLAPVCVFGIVCLCEWAYGASSDDYKHI